MNKQQKPVHKDIEVYGLDLSYSESRNRWFASCETGKGAAWYVWDGKDFDLITYSQIPNDLT